MKLWLAFWRYWKWLCVALMTSFAVLAVIAAIILFFKERTLEKTPVADCIERGGTWHEDEGACKFSA